MQITKNPDGSLTVSIPKSDELYDPTKGGLYVAETVTQAEFDAALHPPKDKPASEAETAKAAKKADEERVAEEERQVTERQSAHNAAAQELQLQRDRVNSQAANDQRIASEKAALSAAATARNAQAAHDALIAGAPLPPAGPSEVIAAGQIHEKAEEALEDAADAEGPSVTGDTKTPVKAKAKVASKPKAKVASKPAPKPVTPTPAPASSPRFGDL